MRTWTLCFGPDISLGPGWLLRFVFVVESCCFVVDVVAVAVVVVVCLFVCLFV